MSRSKARRSGDETKCACVTLRVLPGASRNEISIAEDGSVKVKVAARPVEGAANEALVKFLSKVLSVPKSSITIKSGEKSRDKSLLIEGLTTDEVSRALQAGATS